MNSKLNYASYFTFNRGFDAKRYIDDMFSMCITNNITNSKECFLFHNREPMSDDEQNMESKFTNLKKCESVIKDCIKNNQSQVSCYYKNQQNCCGFVRINDFFEIFKHMESTKPIEK